MRTLLRTMLLWLMLLAMPLQAFAYAGMVAHEWQHSLEGKVAHVGMHDDADHIGAVAPHHVHHGGDQHQFGHHEHAGADHACDCSLCCAPIVPSPMPALATSSPESQAIAFTPPYFYGFVPSLPERPPYSLPESC